MNRSPGETPCLGEEAEECLLELGEVGGIAVRQWSRVGTLAPEADDVTSIYEEEDAAWGGAAARRWFSRFMRLSLSEKESVLDGAASRSKSGRLCCAGLRPTLEDTSLPSSPTDSLLPLLSELKDSPLLLRSEPSESFRVRAYRE